MKCVICGKQIDKEKLKKEPDYYKLSFYVCSSEHQRQFNENVEEIFRQRHKNLIGKSLVLDPAVGDEYGIARSSAKSRIKDELSRNVRLQEMKENLEKLNLPQNLVEHLMMLNESRVGSNTVDIMIDGKLYTVFFGGYIEPTKGYGYYWERVMGGWQEVRDDEYKPKFLKDEDMRFPHYGDVEGAPAITVIEHHALPEELPEAPKLTPSEERKKKLLKRSEELIREIQETRKT